MRSRTAVRVEGRTVPSAAQAPGWARMEEPRLDVRQMMVFYEAWD